jgi:FkbM family methyltransferase
MTLPEFVYTVLLKPRPLRMLANGTLRALTPRTVRRHGACIHLNPRDPVVSGSLALGIYERPETDFFLEALRPGTTVLDIGANVGYYSALALSRIGPNGRLFAVEPDPENFQYLERTVGAGADQRVRIARVALADMPGTLRLYTNSENRGDNRLYANDLADGSIDVEVMRGDDLLREWGVEQVDLIKIDVQGYEARVFSGLERTLVASPNLVIMSEFWPWGLERAGTNPAALLERLRGIGFTLSELLSHGATSPITDDAAFILRYPGRQYANIVARSVG